MTLLERILFPPPRFDMPDLWAGNPLQCGLKIHALKSPMSIGLIIRFPKSFAVFVMPFVTEIEC